jgi:hypothetical protein
MYVQPPISARITPTPSIYRYVEYIIDLLAFIPSLRDSVVVPHSHNSLPLQDSPLENHQAFPLGFPLRELKSPSYSNHPSLVILLRRINLEYYLC